jgi:hypothetical protein
MQHCGEPRHSHSTRRPRQDLPPWTLVDKNRLREVINELILLFPTFADDQSALRISIGLYFLDAYIKRSRSGCVEEILDQKTCSVKMPTCGSPSTISLVALPIVIRALLSAVVSLHMVFANLMQSVSASLTSLDCLRFADVAGTLDRSGGR